MPPIEVKLDLFDLLLIYSLITYNSSTDEKRSILTQPSSKQPKRKRNFPFLSEIGRGERNGARAVTIAWILSFTRWCQPIRPVTNAVTNVEITRGGLPLPLNGRGEGAKATVERREPWQKGNDYRESPPPVAFFFSLSRFNCSAIVNEDFIEKKKLPFNAR